MSRQDTPPSALARDRCWWQISWLAGRCLRPPSREFENPSGEIGRRLTAYSCGGSRGFERMTLAPRSLLIPTGTTANIFGFVIGVVK
jgi:hypothetical protein